MKTRIISIVLVIGTGIAFPCFSQSVGLYANRKNILVSNPDPSHSTTVTVYWRNRLKSKTTLRPNQREYVVTKTITSPRDIKKVRYQFDYDEDAFELDQTIRHEKMKKYLDKRNEGALNQCYNRMKLDAILRVMFGVFLGDTGKKIISISDAFRLNVGQPHTFDRVESDLRLLASEESEFMKSLEWAIDQFNINNKADPFNYCPNLESDIKRYNRLYLKLKFDTSIEEHYNQIKISNLTSKRFPISNQISKENRKSLRSVQPATFFDASFFLGATGIGGEFKLGYSPFKTKYFRKENRSGKIFITAGVGKYIGKFSPTEITSFTNSTKDVHYVLPKHSAKNGTSLINSWTQN